jgi:hypothetical protein
MFVLTLLKGFCNEALQLGRVERIETARVLYLVVNLRINRLPKNRNLQS